VGTVEEEQACTWLSAATNGSEVATATIKLAPKQSGVNVSASYAGESMVTGNSDMRLFTIT
jgi:hypothetical protein